MAREVIIIEKLWCDPCAERGIETEAIREENLTFGERGKPKVLAVCEPCDKEVVLPLKRLYDEGVAQIDPTRKSPRKKAASQAPREPAREPAVNGEITCRFCIAMGADRTTFKESAFAVHMSQRHKVGMKAHDEVVAGRYAITAISEEGIPEFDFGGVEAAIYRCPAGDVEYDARVYSRAEQQLKQHITKFHPELRAA